MKESINEAEKALLLDEVPIGAIIVYNDKIIGRGHNRRNTMKNTLYHAELSAINAASEYLGDWRLEGCTMFVTVEPCPMCAGAIIQARIKEVVFGTANRKAGCFGSVLNYNSYPFNHKVLITEGVLQDECSEIMSGFFRKLRSSTTPQNPIY